MNHSQSHARQLQHDVWSHNKLICMCTYALTHALATSTSSTYSSTLHFYFSFCQNHNFHIEPTEETLSLYTVYMSYHVNPSCLILPIRNPEPTGSLLSQHLQGLYFSKTLHGCKCLCNPPVKHKSPLEASHMQLLVQTYGPSDLHDNHLFLVQVTSGFSTLNCLGELVWC